MVNGFFSDQLAKQEQGHFAGDVVLNIRKIQLKRAAAQKGKEATLPFAAITACESSLRYLPGSIGVSYTS